MTKEVVVGDGVRAAIGKFGGSLKDFSLTDLGTSVVREVLARSGVRGEDVDHVVFGNVVDTEQKTCISRTAQNCRALRAHDDVYR